MKLLFKNTFKKIGKSIGRFLSIMFIIALGISVFMGLRESTASMLYTADAYYDENKLMDFKIVSTYGFTDGDIKSLEELENIEKVIPSYSLDVISSGKSIRVHALEKDVNNVILIKGRMPKNKDECVADHYKYKINDIVTFENDNLSDFLFISKCKVVGQVKSALYIRDEKGISNVGNGKLSSFVFVNRNVFVADYYTEVYILSKGALKMNSYFEEYEKEILPLKNELEELKPIRETIRYEEILKKANDEIIKIRKELDVELNKATTELNNSKKKLDDGKQEFEKNKTKALNEIDKNQKELNKNRDTILNALSSAGISESEIDKNISDISLGIKGLNEQLLLFEVNSNEYNYVLAQITELEQKQTELTMLQSNLKEINNGLNTLNDNYILLQSELEKEANKLQVGYDAYDDGVKKLEDSKEEANSKIEEAKEEISKIEKPIWYLLDRTDNSGYTSYKEDIVKVEAIAKILPIFFILVVILMVLNTLTRLIEEERTEMGILQSNGFNKSSIVISYLVYVLSAGLIGIGIGMTIGYSVIPYIIYGVFLARYYVPKLIMIVSPLPFSLVITVTISIMTVVTIIACMKELKEVPASLLRLKPPKVGKKIFIEKISFIWNKLNFMGKTTIRNLFRYKKRIVMTVLGVAGCTALLVAGMGINDSINTISKLQYEDIINYDAMYILKKETTKMPDVIFNLFKENGIVNPLLINQNAYTFSFDNKTEDVYVVTPSNVLNFNNYVNLTSTLNDKKTIIPNEGAIISNQMAGLLKVDIGDSISIRNSDNELFVLQVSDIVYNYVSHYIYISDSYYKEVFGVDITYNSVIADGKIEKDLKLSDYDILMINYTTDIIETFDSFVSGLNKIIIMIVVFAGFLAFVVLYNLTIINVSERKREIATFKVLGFYDKEISIYVYRETLMLTVLGIAMGLFLGIYLHRFIMGTAETDNIVFLREISTISYIVSAFTTIFFSVIVQLIINRTLKKIDMIDSLKSNE